MPRSLAMLAVLTLLTAACTAGRPVPPGGRTAAAQYLAIARAGNHRLERDFNRLNGPSGASLSASRAALRDAAATERLFGRRLLSIRFPPATERQLGLPPPETS